MLVADMYFHRKYYAICTNFPLYIIKTDFVHISYKLFLFVDIIKGVVI